MFHLYHWNAYCNTSELKDIRDLIVFDCVWFEIFYKNMEIIHLYNFQVMLEKLNKIYSPMPYLFARLINTDFQSVTK